MADGNSWIQTFTGKRIDPLAPRSEQIDPRDIAHALAMQCRFTGHTRYHYSIAQHTVLMVRLLSSQWPSPQPLSQRWDLVPGPSRLATLALGVALHDASEAYLCDIARPVKRATPLAGYRDVEAALDTAIALRFGMIVDLPMAEEIKRLDGAMLHREARSLIAGDLEDWNLDRFGPPANVDILPWTPGEAESALLTVFARLGVL